MNHRRVSVGVWILIFASLSFGCTNADREEDLVEVRDSMGVALVHSRGPQWNAATAWMVSSRPSLVIGSAEGDETETLYRVSSALRLENGDVLVSQSSSAPHFRIYNSDGTHVKSFGAAGEGPGEFRLLGLVCVRGDTIHAYDPDHGRLSALTREGTLIGVRSMTPVFTEQGIRADAPVWMDAFSDCDLVGRANRIQPEDAGPATFPFWRLGLEDLSEDTVVLVTGGEWTVDGSPVRFASFPWPVAGDSTLFVSNDGDFTIHEYTKNGQLLKRFARDHDAVPIPEGDLRRLGEREGPRSLRYAEHWPAHKRRMIVDEVGNLWMNHFVPPFQEREYEEWSVFDPEGVFLGVVETPAPLRIMEIGEDYVLGVWRDSMDVESVRSFELHKGSDLDRQGSAGFVPSAF